ncbi:MAG: hypothetical protein U0271_26080 [Polyangiaceae bacterium]
MSVNMWLSISVWGYNAEREPALRSALERLLAEEGLENEFKDRPSEALRIEGMDLVQGGRMLQVGSRYAVGISDFARFEAHMSQLLRARVAEAHGGLAQFTSLDADDWYGGQEHHLHAALHAVRNLLFNNVEEMRRKDLQPLLPNLMHEYFRLPAWQQRDEMLHLMMDFRGPEVEPIWRDILRAPADSDSLSARSFSHRWALACLEGTHAHEIYYEAIPERTARVVARVAAGMAPAAARAAEFPGRPERRSALGQAPVYRGRLDPLDRVDEILELSHRTSGLYRLMAAHFAKRGALGGGFVWRELLQLLVPNRRPGLLDGMNLHASLEGLRIDSRDLASPDLLVEFVRELFDDGELLDWLLVQAVHRIQARRRNWATIDPLFGEPLETLLPRLWDGGLSTDEQIRLARHPEPYVHEELLGLGEKLAAEAVEILRQSPSARVRQLLAPEKLGQTSGEFKPW